MTPQSPPDPALVVHALRVWLSETESSLSRLDAAPPTSEYVARRNELRARCLLIRDVLELLSAYARTHARLQGVIPLIRARVRMRSRPPDQDALLALQRQLWVWFEGVSQEVACAQETARKDPPSVSPVDGAPLGEPVRGGIVRSSNEGVPPHPARSTEGARSRHD